MRSDPAQSCGEVVRTVRVQAATEYGEEDDFYKHLVAELGTDSALERQMLRVKHEIIGSTPKSSFGSEAVFLLWFGMCLAEMKILPTITRRVITQK